MAMRVAVMQPYLFPYLGYFQLLGAVDHFVALDDAAFIKQGWINRNRILAAGEPERFTVPLSGASSNRQIREVRASPSRYPAWRRKFLLSLRQHYGTAPGFTATLELVERVLPEDAGGAPISTLAVRSLVAVMDHVGRPVDVSLSSEHGVGVDLRGADRVVAICRSLGATEYVNSPGGRALYRPEEFVRHGIRLAFLVPGEVEYPQRGRPFVAGLSMIDVLMFNSPPAAAALLDAHELDLAPRPG